MAIYKLKDVLTLQRGYDLPYHKLEPGIYPVVQSNGISKYHSRYKVNSSEGVITGRSGTIGEVHFVEGPFWPHNTTLYVSDFKGNLPKYIYYLLKQLDLKKFSTGTGVPTLNRNHLNYVPVYLPSLKLQKEIIDIIEPVEELFLKYSHLVRIDTVDNCKNDISNLIDIIAPLERLISSLTKQRTTILKIIDSLNIPKSDSLVEFELVKTGKRNANHESNEGKYNFYTCGQEVKKCNEYSFDGKYILLSGNANLYSWWYNGKFDLYQRVYALRPKMDFFTTYYSVQLAMQKLRDESSGSVIKYIKLDDIYNIELYSNKYEHILRPLYICVAKIDELLSHTTTILDNQVKLLIK